MTALVLQARLDSTRLNEKSMLPLGGKALIFRVMEAFSNSSWGAKILACPHDSVSSFAPLAEEAGFTIFAGPKEDVLARYCLVIRHFGAGRIVRATGDNPFVFVDAAESIITQAGLLGADYASFSGLPHGAGVEAINSEALLRAEKEAKAETHREHVCPYLYEHPELFRLHRPLAPLSWQCPKIRITVDTREDYERALILYEHLSSLPPEKRNLGENIISAYKYIFSHTEAQRHEGHKEYGTAYK